MTRLPNLLSLSRIAAIPVLLPLFYWEHPFANWVAMAVFTAAALTDVLDGYVARARGMNSRLGAILDPIADKLLVASAILMLVAFDRAPVMASVVILCREILVSGLREHLATLKVGIPVSRLAKWKTFIQMVAIGFLLVGPAGPWFFDPRLTTQAIGEGLLWLAASLTLVTGYDYLVASLRHVREPADAKPAGDPALVRGSGPKPHI